MSSKNIFIFYFSNTYLPDLRGFNFNKLVLSYTIYGKLLFMILICIIYFIIFYDITIHIVK